MLGKTIKYDLLFGYKSYLSMTGLLVGLMILSIAAGLSGNGVLLALSVMVSLFATMALAIMYVAISIGFLNKQLCRRESYFGYTAPVSAHTNILSKNITLAIWGVFTVLVITLFWVVVIAVVGTRNLDMSFAEIISYLFNTIREELKNTPQLWAVLGFMLSTSLVNCIFGVVYLVYCATLVNVPALKERSLGLPAAVVAYFIGSNILSFVPVILWDLYMHFGSGLTLEELNAVGSADKMFMHMVTSFTVIYTVATLGFIALFYFLSVRNVKKHLSV
jgi:hypothetical protein